MFRSLLLVTLFLYSFSKSLQLRVMTFNIWRSGVKVQNGIEKIAKHIKLVDPDIVSLQEIMSGKDAQAIRNLLLGNWSIRYGGAYTGGAYTKHKFDESSSSYTSKSNHRLIEISKVVKINFWSVYADGRQYGPYAAFNKSVKKEEEILVGEELDYGRTSNIQEIVRSRAMQSALKTVETVPIIVAGDFNSPSHEDWIEESRNTHAGWTIEWPTTRIMVDELKMIDSFRFVNRNVTSNPGYTWSTCDKYNRDLEIAEPQDRIDYIFYRGPLVAISSRVYSGNDPITPIPNQWNNDWPLDHAAVITDFTINL